MKDNVRQIRVCPLCGKTYGEAPALSRTDNETLICPDCGTRQALESIGIDAEERERILSIIHQSYRRKIHNFQPESLCRLWRWAAHK